jgi:hypothetical protein
MKNYDILIEESMKVFYNSLNERDRRRYAAIEAIKLGHGGIEYISKILSIDPKTIKKGIEEVKKNFNN